MNDRKITDRDMHAAFQARAEGSPSPDLAERIRTETRKTNQQRRLAFIPGGLLGNSRRLMWAAALSATSLALIGGLLLAGRQDDDHTSVLPTSTIEPSPSEPTEPSPSASATPSASLEPSAAPTPFAAALSVDTFAAVVGGSAVPVSGQPGGPRLPQYDFTFQPGFPLVVLEGPVVANDVEWYYFDYAEHVIDSSPGWAPTEDSAGTQWIIPTEVACLASPMTTDQMKDAEFRLTSGMPICYGDTEIRIIGRLSCQAGDPLVTGPSWLGPHNPYCELDAEIRGLRVYGTTLWDDGLYSVTGHFDDPQSAKCAWPDSDLGTARDPRSAVIYCRSLFVATSVVSAR